MDDAPGRLGCKGKPATYFSHQFAACSLESNCSDQATLSSYDQELFATQEEWKIELDKTAVRLQWDPDHDPFGNKQIRKAIQIGMKGGMLKQFCTEWITGIEDITGFVKEEYEKLLTSGINELNVPYEEVLALNDKVIERRIGINPGDNLEK